MQWLNAPIGFLILSVRARCVLFLSSSHPLEMSAIFSARSLDQTYDAIEPKGAAEVAEQMAQIFK